MKFLAMHITNQKLCFDTFRVGHLQNIFTEHDLYMHTQWCDFKQLKFRYPHVVRFKYIKYSLQLKLIAYSFLY